MLTPQFAHNEDLAKLASERYDIYVIDNKLVILGIPYVNDKKEILFGTLFCPLEFIGGSIVAPKDHTVYFDGEYPCNQFGQRTLIFVHSPANVPLNDKICGRFYFSSRREGGYKSYYDKMTQYIGLLSAPAKSIDPSVEPKHFDYVYYMKPSFFNYNDSNTARAEIGTISNKLYNQKIAIVGLGGTGAYLLDFISKTPVSQISLFDEDDFENHNAFRAPGAASIEELNAHMKKVDFFKMKYDKMHKGIIAHNVYIDKDNVQMLQNHDFVFLAIDDPTAKIPIIEFLVTAKIPFVDLGMGVEPLFDADSLRGTIRRTLVTSDNPKSIARIQVNENNDQKGVYSSNIQIAELNALNAILGIITWKKLFKFYSDDGIEKTNTTFVIDEEDLVHGT